jgi:site-specific recombinase XerD
MLEPLIDDFLEYLEVERGRSPLTIREYRHYLNRFLNWLNTNTKGAEPGDISSGLVRKYRLYLAHINNPDGTLLKHVTQSYHIIALRAFLRYLTVQRDILTLSPDKIELPKQSPRLVTFLTNEQVERLLNSPKISDEAGLRDKAILETESRSD